MWHTENSNYTQTKAQNRNGVLECHSSDYGSSVHLRTAVLNKVAQNSTTDF